MRKRSPDGAVAVQGRDKISALAETVGGAGSKAVLRALARYAPLVLVMVDCGSRTHPTTITGGFVNALDPVPQEGH